jgi:plastocyanin
MRLFKAHPWLVAIVTFGLVTAPAIAGFEPPPVEAVNEGGGIYGESHHWSHVPQTINAGEKVTFSNLSVPEVPHGVEWRSTLKATCEKGGAGEGDVPVGTTESASATKWSGKCTFSQPGVYTFWCTRHHQEMSGTITVPGTATAKTTPASGENQTEAMLGGTVEPAGNAIEYRFEYGAASVSEHTTPTAGLGTSDFTSHSVSAALAGLMPGKEYHFQLIVTYGAGQTTVLGGEQTFKTPSAAAPTALTTEATGRGEHEATLNGTVDPDGGAATEYFFEYGTTASYGERTPPVGGLPADNVHHQVSATVSELQSGTTYHFRLVTKNVIGGPVNGADRAFNTTSPPPPEETPPSPHENPPPLPSATISGAPPSPEPLIPLAESPRTGPPLSGLSLRASQRGPSVRGSIDVSPAGAGGRLEVAMFATGASLAAVQHPAGVRVGRLLRSSVRAGVVKFTTPLSARGRAALHRRHRLALTVRIVLTPVSGAPATLTKSMVLRG